MPLLPYSSVSFWWTCPLVTRRLNGHAGGGLRSCPVPAYSVWLPSACGRHSLCPTPASTPHLSFRSDPALAVGWCQCQLSRRVMGQKSLSLQFYRFSRVFSNASYHVSNSDVMTPSKNLFPKSSILLKRARLCFGRMIKRSFLMA